MWVRIRDKHILAIDRETYISDDRFFILKPTNKNAWTLRIRYFVQRTILYFASLNIQIIS